MKSKKLVALVMAATMSIGLITPQSKVTYANTIQIAQESRELEEQVVLLEENFIGDKNSAKALNEGWTFSRDFGGYDSTGNYNTSPSIGLGKGISSGTTDVITTPSFTLQSEGELSFYLKSQGIKADSTSQFLVKCFNGNGEVIFEKVFDAAELASYVTVTKITIKNIPVETTNINFEYTKNVGNLTFDDVRLTHIEAEEIEGVTSIKSAKELVNGTETTIRGVVSFNDRNQTLHIQDRTGAIAISNNSSKIDLSQFTAGDEVEVIGTLDTFRTLRQVQATES